MAHLVDKDAHHVTFRSLERTESPSKVELQIVLLTFHTDAEEDATLTVQIHPLVVRQEITVATGVEADVGSSDGIMLSDERAIAHADHKPQWLLDGDIERLFP